MRAVIINHLMIVKKRFSLPMPPDASESAPKRKDKLGLIFGLILVSFLAAIVIFS